MRARLSWASARNDVPASPRAASGVDLCEANWRCLSLPG
jgi:hypothetical protein